MKNKIITFICGFISALILSFAFVPALASGLQPIEAVLNSVNITLNGMQVTKIGEGYVREGTEGEIPQSINYQGTIYLPLRRISEILDVNVNYDNNTKTVSLTTNIYENENDINLIIPTINNNSDNSKNTVPTNIESYIDFKNMWIIEEYLQERDNYIYYAIYGGSERKNEFISIWNNISIEDKINYSKQLAQEKQAIYCPEKNLKLIFVCSWSKLGESLCSKEQELSCSFYENPFN